jgi:hypothetical protein
MYPFGAKMSASSIYHLYDLPTLASTGFATLLGLVLKLPMRAMQEIISKPLSAFASLGSIRTASHEPEFVSGRIH